MVNQIKSYSFSSDEDLIWVDITNHLGMPPDYRLDDYKASKHSKVNKLYQNRNTTLILISHEDKHVCYLTDMAEDAVYILFMTSYDIGLANGDIDALDVLFGLAKYRSDIDNELKGGK